MNIPSQVTQYTDQSLSAIHHALRAPRRRLVVGLIAYRVLTQAKDIQADQPHTHVAWQEDGIETRQLAKEVTSIEQNIPLDHATGDLYHNTYTALIQTHLPELDNLGVVEYDDDRKRVYPDRNLVAMAMVAAITSPVAQTLFHNAISEHDLGGPESIGGSTGN